MEALWFQLVGAGLLWWEANATPQSIRAVISEARRAPPKPSTFPEKMVWFLSSGVALLFWVLAYVLVAGALLAKGDSRRVLISETEWTIVFIIASICIWGGGRYLETRQASLRKRIMLAAPAEEETLIRRALRTIGFALLFISTLIQLYPALTN